MSANPIKDHKGVVHDSLLAMCRHYNVQYERTRQRIIRFPDMSLEEILFSPNMRGNPVKCTYNGRHFDSYRSLARYLGINKDTVLWRIANHGGKVVDGMFDSYKPAPKHKIIRPSSLLKNESERLAYITNWR